MRPKLLILLLPVWLLVWFGAASARDFAAAPEEPPVEVAAEVAAASSALATRSAGREIGKTTGAAFDGFDDPGDPGGGASHAASPQLLSGEVAVLLEHLQSQHVYLKHLENVRRALEKELSIVRLMRECDGLGSACTGRGIVAKSAPPASSEPPPPTSPAFEAPPAPAPLPEIVYELPAVAGVYRGVASLIYANRRVEARPGTRVGPFTVTAVGLDRVRLDGPRGEVSLPLRWTPPERVRSSDEAFDETSGGSLARPLGTTRDFRGAR